MKKTTKRIILSAITLVLVVVALGTTTFAWFTLSNVATVSNITADVQAGEGLEIALGVKGSTVPITGYKTNLLASDWTQLMANPEYDGFEFGAITTEEGTTFSTLVPTAGNTSILVPKLEENGDLTNVKGGYLEFDIYFKSNSTGTIQWTSMDFSDSLGTAFLPGVPFTKADGTEYNATNVSNDDTITVSPANAARVAIYNATTPALKVVQEVLDTNGNTVNATGIVAGQFSYLTAKGNNIDLGSGNLDNTTVVDVPFLQADQGTNNFEVATITTANTPAQATVKIWLEGWDADMYDALFRSTLNVNLGFELTVTP